MARQLDELKTVIDEQSITEEETKKKGISSYEEYFGEMEISDEEKEKRISLAKTFEILFLFYFLSLKDDFEADYQPMLKEKYIQIANEFLEITATTAYINDRATDLSKFVDEVTRQHIDDEYFTSIDRGMLLSANESNVVGNYGDFVTAVKNGKTQKTWITERDSKVRRTHKELDRKTVGIFDVFLVGDYYMRFPKDTSFDASVKEIANCRCTIRYT